MNVSGFGGVWTTGCTLLIALASASMLDSQATAQEPARTLTFESADGLPITADVYIVNPDKTTPMIVLCHQAGWSRGEYREIAPKLNELGFSCIAIDQRSGGKINGVDNLTAQAASAAGKGTSFADAEQDIIAAIKYVRQNLTTGKVILWGSSYSAALALRIAGENGELIDGALAFAPGEYFSQSGKPEDWIQTSAVKISDPVFVTSARKEATKWRAIYDAIPGNLKRKFVPETDGNHGSRALWKRFADNDSYWNKVRPFLKQFTSEP